MIINSLASINLVGRQAELHQISQIFAADRDLLIAGVPGSGRRTVVYCAAQQVGARVIEIDCLKATDSQRFLTLLADAVLAAFPSPADRAHIHEWSIQHPIRLDLLDSGRSHLVWQAPLTDEWIVLQTLLALPQALAEGVGCRVVMVFHNFPHIRSWDRSEQWESYLRQEIQRQSRVSYVLIATVAESWVQQSDMQVIFLGPIQPVDLRNWLVAAAQLQGLQFEETAIQLFLDYVQGHFGDAIALLNRVSTQAHCLKPHNINPHNINPHNIDSPNDFSYSATSRRVPSNASVDPRSSPPPPRIIPAHQIQQSAIAILEDRSNLFEALLLLLPPSQVRVLESLATDPTDTPHSREYIQKHHLSRGGGLQGALASLQQKGLVYGSDYNYRITMPFLALWLKQHLA